MLKQAMAAISGSLDKISISLIEIIKYYKINIKSIKYIQYRNGIDPLKDSFITCKTIARVNGFFPSKSEGRFRRFDLSSRFGSDL